MKEFAYPIYYLYSTSLHLLIDSKLHLIVIFYNSSYTRYYTPEATEQLKQWVFEGERAPKTVESAGKSMTSIFWDACGIIYTKYLENHRIWLPVTFFHLQT